VYTFDPSTGATAGLAAGAGYDLICVHLWDGVSGVGGSALDCCAVAPAGRGYTLMVHTRAGCPLPRYVVPTIPV